MGNFFRGWRRKFGVVTLVLACAFMTGWLRSLSVRDTFLFQREQRKGIELFGHLSFISSNNGRIKWVQWDANSESGKMYMSLDGSYFTGKSGTPDVFDSVISECRLQFCGIEFWDGPSRKSSELNAMTFVLPYGFLVVPLTLLSAYMLISEPRSRHLQNVVDTVTAAGT